MNHRRIFKSAFVSVWLMACVGATSGCGTGVEEIPLAKVPPPPEGFLKRPSKVNVPRNASPTNANELRR
jgi:hypothetical protein